MLTTVWVSTRLELVPSKCRRVSPAAAQTSLAESADTALRPLTPVNAGLETMLHLVPSQCSTRAPPLPLPTAQTLFDETTVTALRLSPSIVGPVVSTLQLVPSQCSISCNPKSGLSGPVLNPTAQTSLLAAAATPRNWALGGFTPPLGSGGVGTMLQRFPSKCSASVESNTGGAETWSLQPTAQMSLAAIAAVAKSCPAIWGLEATWRPCTPLKGTTPGLPALAWCPCRAFSATAAR